MTKFKQMTYTKENEAHTPKVRDDRMDAVKYWLMVLVIAGHVFSNKEFVDSRACVVLWKWIYIFHMPLFVFVSGYFSRKKDKKDFWPSIWKILEPLIIFQLLTLLPRIIHKGTDSFFINVLTPWWILWYLLSLIYWRLMLQFIPDRVLKHTKLILIGVFSISILVGFLPFNRVLSLQRTLSLMPFFFLGYYMKSKKLYLPDKYKPFCILFLIMMFVIPVFFPQYLGSLKHAAPYNSVYGAMIRIFVFSLAIPMSLAFINVCYNTPWINRQGRLTMQYYIYHALTILPVVFVASKLNMPMSFVTAAIITIGITIGLGVASNIPYFKMFTNPSLFFVKKKSITR